MIPDFLKRENQKESTKLDIEIRNAVERYRQKFGGDGLMSSAWVWPPEEWPAILNECISQNKTIWEVFGEEYDPEADY